MHTIFTSTLCTLYSLKCKLYTSQSVNYTVRSVNYLFQSVKYPVWRVYIVWLGYIETANKILPSAFDLVQYFVFREKVGDLTQSYDKTPYTNRKFENQRTTHTNATKNFDYTTIADRQYINFRSNISYVTPNPKSMIVKYRHLHEENKEKTAVLQSKSERLTNFLEYYLYHTSDEHQPIASQNCRHVTPYY